METKKSKITLKEVMGMDLAIRKVIKNFDKKEINTDLWWKDSYVYESTNIINDAEKRGEERGKREKSLEIANRLLLMGLKVEEISDVIGLPVNELYNLKA
ncbi:hypothetical protein [Clostridium taeniosporum]|uniref:Transposase n=1 Tax=Clostridium taeniosporum TaxID=394958 RepID=A0A1D7XMT1_9CLOT|nr:hypothetical protein [Clostridium taeniosporum]AOR24636.1 hypothetical protein BGI42_13195 [Clostridium taeniosporum]